MIRCVNCEYYNTIRCPLYENGKTTTNYDFCSFGKLKSNTISYDCTKIMDYRKVAQRFCSAQKNQGCENCSLINDIGACSASIFDISLDRIALLQKWSDEHPDYIKMTRRKAFLNYFPFTNDVEEICFNNLIGFEECHEPYGKLGTEGERCYNCWQKEYNGEFEKND